MRDEEFAEVGEQRAALQAAGGAPGVGEGAFGEPFARVALGTERDFSVDDRAAKRAFGGVVRWLDAVRSWFTLPSLGLSLLKESSGVAGNLDSEAVALSVGDLDGVQLAELDLVQNGLAGDAETFRGLVEWQVSVGDVGHEPRSHLVGEPDSPGRSWGDLLAAEPARA